MAGIGSGGGIDTGHGAGRGRSGPPALARGQAAAGRIPLVEFDQGAELEPQAVAKILDGYHGACPSNLFFINRTIHQAAPSGQWGSGYFQDPGGAGPWTGGG
jgi:hypothetical protein